MLWDSEVDVQITLYSNHHFDSQVQDDNGRWMRCTGIYGHPEMGQKKHTWTLLRRLAGLFDIPWLCFGDFNEILHPNEKIGGNDRNLNMISEFREALLDCDLVDLRCKGYPFTWGNGRFGPYFVEERLDKFLCNKGWRDEFDDCAATNLETWTSDHCPVLMEVNEKGGGLSFRRRSVSSCSDQKANQWSVIWTMTLPEKIKIVIWKAAKNFPPTAENLCKRKVLAHPLCQVCGSHMENICHALMNCKSACKVWKSTRLTAEMESFVDQDILSILHELMQRIGKADTELAVAICWATWSARNHFLFKGKKEDPRISAAKAEAVVESFKRIQIPAPTNKSDQNKMAQRCWSPPPTSWVKVNVDAAIRLEDNCAGLGAVIRDANRKVVAAAVKTSKFYGDVAFVEAEAINWGLEIASHAGLLDVIIESDSQETMELINSKMSSRTEIHWIALEVQSKMKKFKAIKVQHIPRSCNAIAHFLAKLALENSDTTVWVGSYPSKVMFLFNSLVE